MCVGPAQGQNERPPLSVERILELLLLGAGRRRRVVSAHKRLKKYRNAELRHQKSPDSF